MADDADNFRSSSDRNRDGIDDDIDRRPGNERESASYSRIYDPASTQEYSNLLEPSNEIQKRSAEQRRAANNKKMLSAMKAAQSDVHFFPDIGRFIIPAENTWAAHSELVLDNKTDLAFNTDKFAFDRIIANKLNIPALVDRNHPDFAKYRGLRTNLEVLRNDIIGQYLDDGSFDRGDEYYVPIINSIAEVLGNALANDVWWKRPFVNYFSQNVANVEAVGAAEMYKFLLRQQDNPNSLQFLKPFIKGMRELAGIPDKNWGILPLSRTPFSPEALSAPPPGFNKSFADNNSGNSIENANNINNANNVNNANNQQEVISPEASLAIVANSSKLIDVVNRFNMPMQAVNELSEEDKAISVEDGRTILRWLRNMQGTDKDVQDFISAGSPQEQEAKTTALSKLIKLYAILLDKQPFMQNVPEVQEGSAAAGGAAMMIAEYAITVLKDNESAKALLASAIDSQPEAHFERSHQSIDRIIEHIEKGLSHLAGKPLGERTAAERILEASARVSKHAYELRNSKNSVDSMTTPRREESVELGREILRKLRNMTFSDKPITEVVDTGRPDDQANLAERIAEAVEIYRNVLAQAVAVDPSLINDQRIKEANDATGAAAHSLKLMAAKEIPNNIAQTQQISADVTQMPQEWKSLNDRAVDRLVKTMEGGLEAAVDSINQQEQDQQREEEMAQEAIDTALLNSDNARRKKRKRRSQRSGLGGKKQEKINRDIMADDRAAGQGRFRDDDEQKKPKGSGELKNALNLNEKDLEKIKSIGNKLQGIGNSAKALPTTNATNSLQIMPDDKTAAERAVEQALQSRRNNRNSPRA